MFMRKVAYFLCLQCLCAAAGMLVRFDRIACAARQQCLLPAETWLFVTENVVSTPFSECFFSIFFVSILLSHCASANYGFLLSERRPTLASGRKNGF